MVLFPFDLCFYLSLACHFVPPGFLAFWARRGLTPGEVGGPALYEGVPLPWRYFTCVYSNNNNNNNTLYLERVARNSCNN